MSRYVVPVTLILTAAFSRLLPHPPNVAPVTALALFGAVYLERRQAFLIPIGAMLLSDLLIGFHTGMPFVYGSFILMGCIGLWLKSHRGIAATAGATLAGSVVFFMITNFGVWLLQHGTYPRTFSGLVECYVAAIPFFRNTLLGDIGYVVLLFGSYGLGRRFVPGLAPESGNR